MKTIELSKKDRAMIFVAATEGYKNPKGFSPQGLDDHAAWVEIKRALDFDEVIDKDLTKLSDEQTMFELHNTDMKVLKRICDTVPAIITLGSSEDVLEFAEHVESIAKKATKPKVDKEDDSVHEDMA